MYHVYIYICNLKQRLESRVLEISPNINMVSEPMVVAMEATSCFTWSA